MNFQFVDVKSGARLGPMPEPKPEPRKPTRPLSKLPNRSSLDRKGFNGR